MRGSSLCRTSSWNGWTNAGCVKADVAGLKNAHETKGSVGANQSNDHPSLTYAARRMFSDELIIESPCMPEDDWPLKACFHSGRMHM